MEKKLQLTDYFKLQRLIRDLETIKKEAEKLSKEILIQAVDEINLRR